MNPLLAALNLSQHSDLTRLIILLIAAVIGYFLGMRLIGQLISGAFRIKQEHMSGGEKRRRDTIIRVTQYVFTITLAGIAFLTALSIVGINIAPLIAGAGVIGIAISLGSQAYVRDVIAGLFIITENQYRVGDIVTIAGVSGTVEDITLRSTSIRSLNGNVHIVPNGTITTVTNQSKGYSGIEINLTIDYGSDLEAAIAAIDQVGAAMAEEAEWKALITEAPHFLRVDNLSGDGIVLKVTGKTLALKQALVAGEFRQRLLPVLEKADILIAGSTEDAPAPKAATRGRARA